MNSAACEFEACEWRQRYRCRHCGFLSPFTTVPPERIYKTCDARRSWIRARLGRGLGDTLAWLIHTFTFGLVTPCAGCDSRRAWLNRLVPYRRK